MTDARILLPEREELLQQPALVQDLDAARAQAERADCFAGLGILLQHEHLDIVQQQLAGRHHPRRAAAANDQIEQVKPQSEKLPSGRLLCRSANRSARPYSEGFSWRG